MKSVLLIGLGRFGRHMAAKLQELHHEVLAVDKNEERVNDALDLVTHAQIGDSTSEAFIASLGVRNFDICVVAIGDDFQSSLETTALLKDWPGRPGTSTPSSCCATGRTTWCIPSGRPPAGPRCGTAPTMSLTTSG